MDLRGCPRHPPALSPGFTECKKIAAIAQACPPPSSRTCGALGIGLAVSLQFMATSPPTPLSLNPEEPMLEYDTSSHPFRQDLRGGGFFSPREGARSAKPRHRRRGRPRHARPLRPTGTPAPGTGSDEGPKRESPAASSGGYPCPSSGFDSLATPLFARGSDGELLFTRTQRNAWCPI